LTTLFYKFSYIDTFDVSVQVTSMIP